MDFSYILKTSRPDANKLKALGFVKSDNELIYKKEISGGEFYAVFHLKEEIFTAEVYESDSNEKYVLFDVEKADGSFIGQIRKEVQNLVNEIRKSCFENVDVKLKFEEFLQNHFSAKPDYPWEEPTYIVYRCQNEKWFALIMKITFKQLGFQSDEPVWVVNLKSDEVEKIVDRKSVFPAYHMNKKYWITVLLTGITDFNLLCELTQKSYNLVKDKK